MKEINKDMRNKELIEELISLWENSVKETHSFLSVKEIEDIKQYVPQALKAIEHLIVEFDDNEKPIAFMGIVGEKFEMLFISPNRMKKGLGRKLLEEAIKTIR